MIAFALISAAFAGDPEGVFTTVVQGRPDMVGNVYPGVWATAQGAMNQGTSRYEGYGELAFPGGFEGPFAPAIYVLTADGHNDVLDWTLGRQRIALPTNPRLLDGGRIAWHASDTIKVEAFAGEARTTAAGGWAKTAPLARATATFTKGNVVAMAGAWGEMGPTPTEHADVRVRWQDSKSASFPGFSALAVVGSTGIGAVVERARVESSLRPVAGVRTLIYAEHHDAVDPNELLGPSILEAFAPKGGEEGGFGLGWSSAQRSQLWASVAAQTWNTDELGQQVGVRGQASWRPRCGKGKWCLTPQWTAASGPGGFYHSVVASVVIPTPDALKLTTYAAVAPYRKVHQPLDVAGTLGLSADVMPADKAWSLQFGADATTDAIAKFDPRVWAALRVKTR